MKKCPRCGKENALIDPQYGVLPGKRCQARDAKASTGVRPEFYTLSQHSRVARQRDIGAKDMLQPYGPGMKPNPEFAKAYPDKVENYFSKKELSKM